MVSAAIFYLKRKARLLSRQLQIPLHVALNRVAQEEGFGNWSLLADKHLESAHATRVFSRLAPGDLLLLAARPSQGKTLLSLELAIEAMRSGQRAIFFSLEFTQSDVENCFRQIGVRPKDFHGLFEFDGSEELSAQYVIQTLVSAPRGTLVIVDYLQLLDQKRDKPELAIQMRELQSFAKDKGLIVVFLSQVDRSYDAERKPFPDLDDIRLPNRVELGVFTQACFLNKGHMHFQAVGR
nr:DNA helicase [Rhizobium sp. CFBP 8762]